jgi:hypothetical protein
LWTARPLPERPRDQQTPYRDGLFDNTPLSKVIDALEESKAPETTCAS